jgi:hypothetical protein
LTPPVPLLFVVCALAQARSSEQQMARALPGMNRGWCFT